MLGRFLGGKARKIRELGESDVHAEGAGAAGVVLHPALKLAEVFIEPVRAHHLRDEELWVDVRRNGARANFAAIFEAAGAILAGGDVVNTVARDLLVGHTIDTNRFVLLMMAALLASALWVNLATYIGAPVSTTHAVVGGVVGAGVAAAGWTSVAWPTGMSPSLLSAAPCPTNCET